MNRSAFVGALILVSLGLVSCGSYSSSGYRPPSGLTMRVFASQSVSGPTTASGLVIINGSNDTVARGAPVSAGISPGLMAISGDRTTVLAFDSSRNMIEVVNAKTESLTGGILLPGPTTSMVALSSGAGYAAVPSAVLNGSPPGVVEVMNLAGGGITSTVSVPNAQTVVANPDGTVLLVFSADSDVVTIVSPLLVNTGVPVTSTVSGFDRPVYAVFSSDGGTAYVMNCGPQCGSTTASASVQPLSLAPAPALSGPAVAVDAATIGWVSGSTLYVVGTPATAPNNLCTGQTTQAPTCGRLDIVDLTSLTVTASFVITDGYHDRIDLSNNGQLFIGSHTCSTVGNVNAPQGEVRGCLTIFNTTNSQVIVPPDNGDVTGLQGFTSRTVEYVAEGGNLRVYDTAIDSLLVNDIITGTIGIAGQVVDVKAIDFF